MSTAITIKWDREWEEFIVRENTHTYHTTDALDALETAKLIAYQAKCEVKILASAKSRIAKVQIS